MTSDASVCLSGIGCDAWLPGLACMDAGYGGESARRIWKSIYEENCFFKHRNVNPFSLDSLCFEERIFYRAISGLHTSINVHLSAAFPVNKHSDHFAHNADEFVKRFAGNSDAALCLLLLLVLLLCLRRRRRRRRRSLSFCRSLPQLLCWSQMVIRFLCCSSDPTRDAGQPNYITNLYFLYLLELRALAKIGPYFMARVNWKSSGDSAATRDAIKDLLENVR